MSKEIETYYNELFEMFGTPGWKHFEEYIAKIHDTHVDKGWTSTTGEQLLINKGIVFNIKQIKNFRVEHETAFENIKADESSSHEE